MFSGVFLWLSLLELLSLEKLAAAMIEAEFSLILFGELEVEFRLKERSKILFYANLMGILGSKWRKSRTKNNMEATYVYFE